MAIYHFSAQVVSRSCGRSAVAAVAYRAAERIHDESLGKTHDYTKKAGVEHSEILTPENAPAWMLDRAKLWNRVEEAEKRKDAQLAREVQVALPIELSKEAQVELVRDFAREHFVDRGMVADISIHRDNPDNPHAHIMLTMREIGEDGFGKKNRAWNSKEQLKSWREEWAKSANLALAMEDHCILIDHRSFQEQQMALEPTRKLGINPREIEKDKRDVTAERWKEQQAIIHRNGEAIRENPLVALDAITRQRATFTRSEVGRWLNTRTIDAEQFRACLLGVMNSPELVEMGRDTDGRVRYSTREMLRVEQELKQSAQDMHSRKSHAVDERHIRQAEKERTLSPEQSAALRHVTERSGDVAVIEGYAGAGKSYMLGAAREAWEAQGFRVRGAALAGKAAEGLEESAGISSRSLHSWEYAWKNEREQLTRRDVLVIDEAGMVGSRQMSRVVEKARAAGAKVVLVGDMEQLQAIEAGAPMRGVAEVAGVLTMADIRRQEQSWQREATRNLATDRTSEALDEYERRGHVHEHETKAQAMESMVRAWDRQRQERPEQTQIMLAYRRADVAELNQGARELRKQAGELGSDYVVTTERGTRELAEGDRIYFLKNNRELGVKNGTLATVERMDERHMQVRLDGDEQRRVHVDLSRYNHLDHGYAATVHKCQGVTVDRAHALAGDLFDRHVTYVALSRHREWVDLHWSREEFDERAKLHQTLSRERLKDMALDYAQVVQDNHELSRQVRPETEREATQERSRELEPKLSEEEEALKALAEKFKELAEREALVHKEREREIQEREKEAREPHTHELSRQVMQAEVEHGREDFRDHGGRDFAVGQDGHGAELTRGARADIDLGARTREHRVATPGEREENRRGLEPHRDPSSGERVGKHLEYSHQPQGSHGASGEAGQAHREADKTRSQEQPTQLRVDRVASDGDVRGRTGREHVGIEVGQESRERNHPDSERVPFRSRGLVPDEGREPGGAESVASASVERTRIAGTAQGGDRGSLGASGEVGTRGTEPKISSEEEKALKALAEKLKELAEREASAHKEHERVIQQQERQEEEQERKAARERRPEPEPKVGDEGMTLEELDRRIAQREAAQEKLSDMSLHYYRLQSETGREPTDFARTHKHQPEVEEAQRRLDIAEWEVTSSRRELEIYESEHPWKASFGSREFVELQRREQLARQMRFEATADFQRVWNDPQLRERSRQDVKEYNEGIEAAKRELEEFEPRYKQAMKEREHARLNECLMDLVEDRDCAGEFREKIEGLRDVHGKDFDPHRADKAVVRDLAKEGFSPGQLKEAMREQSLSLTGLDDKEAERYIDSTVDKVMELPEVKQQRKQMERSLSRGMSLER